MLALIKKARWIFLLVFAIYALSFVLGFSAGALKIVDYQKIKNTSLFKASSSLEKYVPGYSRLIEVYKDWHNKLRNKFLANKDHWGMRALIFLNNWVVANVTMIIRSVFVLPITLSVFGKFFQGVVFAQVSSDSMMWLVFLNEFGGYFLTIAGTLTVVFWTLFYRFFNFKSRGRAFVSGLKILGLAYAFSAVGMLIGSILETKFIMDLYSLFQ